MNTTSTVARHRWLALLLAGWIFWLPAGVQAQERYQTSSSSATGDLITGFASFLVTPVYGAFKLTFAGLGAITGGLTWLFTGGDTATAQKIWNPSMRGTYIITPDHLAGREPIRFIGDP
ncbi:MAG: hypothetical protein Kow0060_06350 [Methylohalobius crimeensis]|uniref:hypothetical protein n=1 Tax=Methylohalobius crimeensis TaxID=244365 RepID=UPI0003B3E691|nr:hypothetical protein [Methylohalobius crimeensis]